MARGAPKASENVWYQARMEAAKWNEKLLSRAGAAEEANMSEDAIKKTELNLEKCMPVEKAVILSDLYNSPNLLNYYCLHECPIGRERPISDKIPSIDRITVKLLKALRLEEIEAIGDRLVDIAEDGQITDDEMPDLEEAVKYLSRISSTVSELENLTKQKLKEHEHGRKAERDIEK